MTVAALAQRTEGSLISDAPFAIFPLPTRAMETIGFIVSAGPLAFDLKSTAHRDSDRVQPYEANGGDDDDDDGEPNPPTGDGDDGRQY